MKNIALILFGGKGSRYSEVTPKQFIRFGDKFLYEWTIEAFQKNEEIDEIDLVCYQEGIEILKEGCKKYSKVKSIIPGGATRQESVKNGLIYLHSNQAKDDDIILIHDGDRPFVSERIIHENIETVKKYGAAITAIPSTDTVLLAKESEVSSYLKRDEVYLAQTPQSFTFALIYEAHLKNKAIVTDDASLLYKEKRKVCIVKGERNNFKITTIEDGDLALTRLTK